ncbi:MAG: hypothetical protein M1480_16025 [Bacteroidetes bacterium]|nr:hypothetical protein [Bacteroidota bacterium]
MKKKISILTIAITFFVSTTSLPVTLYFCNMMETYSFNKCRMDMNVENTMSESCAHDGSIHHNEVNFHSQDCCSIKVIDSKVKDNYLFNHSENVNHIQFISLISVQNISVDLLSSIRISKIYFDTSPPPLSGNPLYLTNSILLI